jgi:hypothetical protein
MSNVGRRDHFADSGATKFIEIGESVEAVLKTAALVITALRGGSKSSCTPVYTPVPRRRAPCSAGARDISKTAS